MPVGDAESKALEAIEKLHDPAHLRTLMENARMRGADTVYAAAFAKLCRIQPSAQAGTVEHDVWQSVFALEEMLKLERGKTVRLGRTRQKIAREGETKTVADLTLKKGESPGFQQLIELGHPELLFEAVVLRHPDCFEEAVRRAADVKLKNAGVDLERVRRNPLEGRHG